MTTSEQSIASTRKNDEDCRMEVERLIQIYESLNLLLKELDTAKLRELSASWDIVIPQARGKLSGFSSKAECLAMKRGMRQGLREVPEIIASAVKIDHADVIATIESKLNLRFSDF